MIKIQLTKKHIVIALALLFAIVGIGGYFAYQFDVSKIQEATMKYWEAGDSRRGGYVIQFAKKDNYPIKFVLTKYDLINPVATVVLLKDKLPDGSENIQLEIFYLKRTGLFEFATSESIIATTQSYKFDQIVELAKKYDLNKENIDKSKIYNRPELNLDPTTLQKVLSDQAKIKESEDKTAAYNKLPQPERQKICEENLAKIKSDYENALKEAANGSTKYSETDFIITKKVIDITDCSKV